MFKFYDDLNRFNVDKIEKRILQYIECLKKRIVKYEKWSSVLQYWKYATPFCYIANDFNLFNLLNKNSFDNEEINNASYVYIKSLHYYNYKNAKKKFLVEKLKYKINLMIVELKFLQNILNNIDKSDLTFIITKDKIGHTYKSNKYIEKEMNDIKKDKIMYSHFKKFNI